MKKIISILFISCLLFIFVTGISFAKNYVLTLSEHDPHAGLKGQILDYWFNEIEKQTDSQVKIKAYWGGALLKGAEQLQGVMEHIVDIAVIYPGFFPKQLPVHQAFVLFPQGPEKWENVKWIYDRAYQEIPELREEIEAMNQIPIFIKSELPRTFISTKPIDSIDDIINQKWRVANRWWLSMLEMVDAIPVSVPWSDCYMALQTGTLDEMIANYDGLHRNKLVEAAPNVFASQKLWWAIPTLYTINLDTWNSIPDDLKKEIIKAGEIAQDAYSEMYEAEFDRLVKEELAEGVKINYFSDDDIAKWADEDNLKKLRAQWIKEQEEIGIKDPAAIINKLKELITEAIEKEK